MRKRKIGAWNACGQNRLVCLSRGSFVLLVDWLDIPGSTTSKEIMRNISTVNNDSMVRTRSTAGTTSEHYPSVHGSWILSLPRLDPQLMRTSLRLTSRRQPDWRSIGTKLDTPVLISGILSEICFSLRTAFTSNERVI